jgi:hypothetical protein
VLLKNDIQNTQYLSVNINSLFVVICRGKKGKFGCVSEMGDAPIYEL